MVTIEFMINIETVPSSKSQSPILSSRGHPQSGKEKATAPIGRGFHSRAICPFRAKGPRRSAAPPRQSLGGLLQVLGFCSGDVRLQPVKIIGGLLRVAGGGEDRPLVVFQDFQP